MQSSVTNPAKYCLTNTIARVVLCLLVREISSSHQLTDTAAFTSCTGRGVTEWNEDPDTIKLSLQSWLLSTVTLLATKEEREAKYHQVHVAVLYCAVLYCTVKVVSLLYNPVNKTWSQHWPGVNHLLADNYLEDEAREVVTVGRIQEGQQPSGLAWQWRSKASLRLLVSSHEDLLQRLVEGFLYGQLDSEGRFTGSDILFLYPDLVTGIRGSWREGVLLSGTAVEVLAERCKVTLNTFSGEDSLLAILAVCQ